MVKPGNSSGTLFHFVVWWVVAIIALTALTGAVTMPWFSTIWFVHVGLGAALLVVCTIDKSTSAPLFDELWTRYVGERLRALIRSRAWLLPAYIVPPLMILASQLTLVFMIYRSAVAFRDVRWSDAYTNSVLAWSLMPLIAIIGNGVDRARVLAEAAAAGHPASMSYPRLGAAMESIATIGSIATFIATTCKKVIPLYVLLSSSMSSFYWAAVVFSVGSTVQVIHAIVVALAQRFQACPALLPSHINWDVATGLILRPFADERRHLVDPDATTRSLFERIIFIGGRMRFGLDGPPLRWLTALREGEFLTAPGVQRVSLSYDEWQEWVIYAMQRSELVVVMAGTSGALSWEIAALATHVDPARWRFVVLPQDSTETLSYFLNLIREVLAPAQMPTFAPTRIAPIAFWWDDVRLQTEELSYGDGWRSKIAAAAFSANARNRGQGPMK